jgi:hypothetical protein
MELILAATACNSGWDWPGVAVLIVVCLFSLGLMWLLLRQF